MCDAIILAAGRSERMGRPKLLLPWGDTSVIEHIVHTFEKSRIQQIHVVVGAPHDQAIRLQLKQSSARMVPNPNPGQGMIGSVRRGLQALAPGCSGFMVGPADQPLISVRLINELLDLRARCGKGIVLPAHAGKRGHPVLLSRQYQTELMTEHHETGLRGLIRAHADDIAELAWTSVLAFHDMDTPEDYQRLLTYAGLGRGTAPLKNGRSIS